MKRRNDWDLQGSREQTASRFRRGEFLHIHVKVQVCCCIWRAAHSGVLLFLGFSFFSSFFLIPAFFG